MGSFRGRLLSASALASVLAFAAVGAQAGGLPHGGHFIAGHGTLNKANRSLTVKQSSTTGIIDWNTFSVGAKNSVTFDNGSGATLNRVTGGNLSKIAGSLHATGSLYLMNDAGVIVSGTGRVVTGGSFAVSTGNLSDTAFGKRFGKVVNRGSITAGGSITLAGRDVADSGTLKAASVNLKAARKLAIGGSVTAQDANGSGGTLTARGRTIVIEATGRIDASAAHAGESGGTVSIVARRTTEVAGTINADGGENGTGGFIETSGKRLHVGDGAKISTLAQGGKTGSWLIDPQDFTIAASGGDITGAALSSELAGTDVDIKSSAGATAGNGDIFVDDAVSWSSGTTLTLDAYRNININAPITITGAGGLTLIDADTSGTGVNDGTPADGDYVIDAPVTFSDVIIGITQGSLTINGNAYTLANSVSQLATDIAGNAAGYYALADDYDASGDGTYATAPIATPFTGTFEGLGNTISNFTVDDATTGDNVGLFGLLGDGSGAGTVRDIGLVNASVIGSGYRANVGGLVGHNYGGTISRSYATGTVTGGDDALVGGLVGFNYSYMITQSYSTATVTGGSGATVGGFVGYNSGTIDESYSTGRATGDDSDDVGGFVGYNDGTIDETYSTGAATGDDASVGGFVGDNGGTIDESYSTGAASGGGTYVGGFAGINNSTLGGTTAVYYETDDNPEGDSSTFTKGGGLALADMMTASNFSGWNFGGLGSGKTWAIVDQDSSLNNASSAAGGTTPMLLSEYATTVTNAHQLQLMDLDPTANYTLANDIDASATAGGDVWGSQGFIPVGGLNAPSEFSGIFEGQSHAIDNLFIDNDVAGASVGLFGVVTGTVENVSLVNANVTGSGDYIGALAGYIQTVENVSLVNANVTGSGDGAFVGALAGYSADGTISQSTVTGTVTGSGNVDTIGGLVGENDASTVVDSWANGTVTDTGTDGYVGGLVGENDGSISDSYHHHGTVSGGDGDAVGGLAGTSSSTITDSWAHDDVSDTGTGAYVGGLVGENYGSISSSHYLLGTVSGGDDADVGGLVGYNASSGTITDSYAHDDVTDLGFDADVGGLVGENYGSISGSHYREGTVSGGDEGDVGGLVGYNDSTITDSWAQGAVTDTGFEAYVGGLVGENDDSISASYYSLDTVTGGVEGSVGGLVGENEGGIFKSHSTGAATGDDGDFIGGLVGENDGLILHSWSHDAVTDTDIGSAVGGLVGDNLGFIVRSHHGKGTVTGGDDDAVGGLVGDNEYVIVHSWAHGTVIDTGSGDDTDVGGLAGYNDGDIRESYFSLGTVTGGDEAAVGGLVGWNDHWIDKSYSTGDASGGIASYVGGLVGGNSGKIEHAYSTGTAAAGQAGIVGGLMGANEAGGIVRQTYSTGAVSGALGDEIGGLVGLDEASSGSIKNSYWDRTTSGITDKSQGAGNIANDAGIRGKHSKELEAALLDGFSAGYWAIDPSINGGLPYLIALTGSY